MSEHDELEEGRRLASEREDLIAQGINPAELAVPLARPSKPLAGSWWVINGGAFKEALHRAADGEDPDLLYAEFYANSDTEDHT